MKRVRAWARRGTLAAVMAALAAMAATITGAPARAAPGPATEQVKATVDQILHILKEPKYQGEANTEARRRAIRVAVTERFGFEEMARRSLGTHWAERTPAERADFIKLFTDLLENSYVSRIETYDDEPIVYVGEAVEGDRAEVRSKIVTRSRHEIPLDYRLLRKGDSWEVYDISVEGVSLVNNYRAQFNRIINSSSYPALVKRMRAESAGTEAERRGL